MTWGGREGVQIRVVSHYVDRCKQTHLNLTLPGQRRSCRPIQRGDRQIWNLLVIAIKRRVVTNQAGAIARARLYHRTSVITSM